MQPIKNRRIQINNLSINYFTGGSGEPLIILHGGNTHAGPWQKNARELSRKYTVYIPDFPGFGLSQRMDGNYYVPELVDFVKNFAGAMGLQKFYLMGHSVGGAVAASYALQYPEQVKKLVLIDSMCMGKEISFWIRILSTRAIIHYLGTGIVGLFKSIKWIIEGVFHSIEFIFPVSEASLIIGSSAVSLHTQSVILINKLSEIIMPTLIVWGKHDRIVPLKHAYAAATVIPDCRVKILNGGHCAYQEKLTEFSTTVIDFLK